MKITRCKDYDSLSLQAGLFVISEIEKKRDLLLCAATGNSPIGLYDQLANKASGNTSFSKNLKILALDEWGGVPRNHPVTCEHFIRTKLLAPLGIPTNRAILFDSNPHDPYTECNRVQSEIAQHGPIDLCILGLGKNGHLGLNEPGPFLEAHCHKAFLSKESMQHDMIASTDLSPQYGLTLGMQDILSAHKILLIISGKGKKTITEDLLEGKISTQLPASFLWLHQDVNCYIDEHVFTKI